MKLFVSYLFVFFIGNIGLHANTYFVSVVGNDMNPGTMSMPWKSLTHASAITAPGDTVFVKAGLYNEFVLFSNSGIPGSPITFIGYKSIPGDTPPLLINNAYPYSDFLTTDMPTFDGGNRGSGIGFNCRNRKYLVIRNFQIRNYAYGLIAGGVGQDAGNIILSNVNTMFTGNIASSYAGYGILFGSMGTLFSNNNSVINCLVVNSAAEGISINGNKNYIKGCKVYCNENSSYASMDYYVIVTGNNNRFDSCYIERGAGLAHNGHGYTAKTNAEQVIDDKLNVPAISAQYNEFRYCVAKNMGESFCVRHRLSQFNFFYHCKAIGTHTGGVNSPGGEGNGIVIRDGAGNNIFDGCIAENCHSAIMFNDTAEDGDTGANPVGHPCNNNRIINGIYINCYAGIYFNEYSIPSDAGDNTVANCTFFKIRYMHIAARSCKNMKYINNIYYGTQSTAPGGYFKGGPFANDIVANSATSYFSNCTFYEIEGGLPEKFLASAVNCISLNPLFKNNSAKDLHLLDGSPCINTGKSIDFVRTDYDSIPRPQGTSFDMGAYESQFVSDPTNSTMLNLVNVFPNPAYGNFYIKTAIRGCKISISDMAGKIIQVLDSKSDLIEIKTGNFLNGVYFVKAQNQEREEVIKVVVVK